MSSKKKAFVGNKNRFSHSINIHFLYRRKTTGVGNYIADAITTWGLPAILLPFFIATLVRFIQGSGTVSLITAASISAPILATMDVNPVFAALSAMIGGLFFSYFNDSYFHVINRSFELENPITIKTNIIGFTKPRLEVIIDNSTFDLNSLGTYQIRYNVTDTNGNFVAVFYADFHPRKGKRNGAWMTSYKSQQIKNGINERPQISIVCNFTKPTETKPSLLTFNEVTTLFHEFGHALHGMLANTTYNSLSGTSVSWDFVELPSQIMENWCYEPEALALFAYHYQTGEMIPMELVQKIKESASFQEGMATMRQLSFGLLDMGWHGQDPSNIKDTVEYDPKTNEYIITNKIQW